MLTKKVFATQKRQKRDSDSDVFLQGVLLLILLADFDEDDDHTDENDDTHDVHAQLVGFSRFV